MILLMAEILHQLIVVYPIIYRVVYIPGGAGFLPSTVVCPDSFRRASWCREIILSSVGAGTAIPLAIVFGKFGVKRSFFGALPGRFDV